MMPGMVLFENGLGGRVAVYPFDFSVGMNKGFMNWRRRHQLQRVVRWLGRDRVDLFVDGGAWMMPLRRDYPNYTFVAVLNFETDPWEAVTLTFDWAGPADGIRFELIDADGSFKPIQPLALKSSGQNVAAEFALRVGPLDFAVWRITP